MLIGGSRTKYYLLSLFGALVVGFGVFAISSASEAQVQPVPTIDKECTPNPVQIGEQVTCTIDVVAPPNTVAGVRVTDTFPADLTVTEANWQFLRDSDPLPSTPCEVDGNTVTCPSSPVIAYIGQESPQSPLFSFRVTIEATAEQCGTFQNTATSTDFVTPPGVPYTVEDTEEITVAGCEEPPTPAPAPAPAPASTPAPITQDSEQDSESGEIDQTIEVS